MSSEEYTRALAQLAELAARAKLRLSGLIEKVETVKSVISDIASSLETSRTMGPGNDSGGQAGNRTPGAGTTQVGAAGK